MLVAGGMAQGKQAYLLKFEHDTATMTPIASMNVDRQYGPGSAIAADGSVWVCGGSLQVCWGFLAMKPLNSRLSKFVYEVLDSVLAA